ncbi:MAG: PASTA domain-containing protein [Coriobacteriia bacterium]|nr:PASTA domain-containing protein [Coriobacteriia bacterium]
MAKENIIRCLGCMNEYDNQILNDKGDLCPICGYDQASEADEAFYLVPGTVLEGKYIVGRALGAGGFGVTYIGYDAMLERTIAIKEYLPGDFATRMVGEDGLSVFPGVQKEQFDAGLSSFVDEAKRLAALSEIKGIVKIYDSFQANNTGYIVMEYLRGRTVKEALLSDGVFSFDEAVRIIISVLDALEDVHTEGIIHRDIAPDNIFLCDDGSVQLIDFGAARYATILHSKSLSVILKPGYAPEEQYRSKGVQGPYTDVYAAAASIYKMITGTTPTDAMDRSLEDNLKAPSSFGITLPKAAENAIMNALNVNASDRYQTAAEFKEALISDYAARNKIVIRPPDTGRVPTFMRIAAALVVVIVASIAFSIVSGLVNLTIGGTLYDPSVAFADGYMNTPDVINLTIDEAQAAADKLGLYFIIADKQDSERAPAGRILSQEPQPGSRIYQGEIVSVVVSAGPPQANGIQPLVVPDMTYRSLDEAIEMLTQAGISYDIVYEENDTIPVNHIISQSYETGTKVSDDTRVLIKVSLGSDSQREAEANTTGGGNRPGDTGNTSVVNVTVPNVVGSTENEAIRALTSRELTYRVVYQKQVGTVYGRVIAQSISSGSVVKTGTSITITVSRGEPDWSAWMIVNQLPSGVAGNSNYQVEYDSRSVTEYRYRTLESSTATTTNTTGVNPGDYTKVGEQTTGYNVGQWGGNKSDITKPIIRYVGGYALVEIVQEGNVYTGSGFGNWSAFIAGSKPADVVENGVKIREHKDDTRPVYETKTQYRYERWIYWNTTYDHYYSTFHGNYGGTHEFTPWFDSPLSKKNIYDGQQAYGSYRLNNGTAWNTYEDLWFNEKTQLVSVQVGTEPGYCYRTQSVVATYTWVYRERNVTPIITYTWQKTTSTWSAWSPWSTNYVEETPTRQTQHQDGAEAQYVRFRPRTQTVSG